MQESRSSAILGCLQVTHLHSQRYNCLLHTCDNDPSGFNPGRPVSEADPLPWCPLVRSCRHRSTAQGSACGHSQARSRQQNRLCRVRGLALQKGRRLILESSETSR